MSKRYKISWRDKDIQAIRRTVANFNAKIRRLRKKNPSNIESYPETISMKDLKSRITTRQDFNREMKRLQRFSKRGSEEVVTTKAGVSITKYELKELKIMRAVVNRKRSMEAKRLGLTPERGLKTQVEKQSLTPKKDVEKVGERDFRKFAESLEKEMTLGFSQQQKENYVSNYIKGLYNKLGFENASKIVKLIENQPADFIVDNSIGNPFLTIDFIYDPLEADTIADSIYREWLDILE